MQRNVIVGTNEYKKGKKGFGQAALIAAIERAVKAATSPVTLRKQWKATIRKQLEASTPTTYTDWNDVLKKLKKGIKKRKLDVEAQDTTITGLLKGATEASKRSRTIAYEFKQAIASLREHIRGSTEYKNTVTELEALPAGAMNDTVTTEVNATRNPAVLFEALLHAKMKRLDFKFHGTAIATHGYELPGDRTVDASTLKAFGFGTIKIGDKDVGSYSKMLEAEEDIPEGDNLILAVLEMFRIPVASAMLALKRDLYAKGETELSEAMANTSAKSNAEFLGAVSGSGLTKDQKKRMRQQQITSNEMTLDNYAANFPDFEIGTQTKDAKPRTTPGQIKGAFDEFIELMDEGTATNQKLTTAKKKARRKLRRGNASFTKIEGVDLDASVSDFDETHYKTETLFNPS